MTQRELEELVLKVDEAFEVGSGPYDQWHARGTAFLTNGHEGVSLRRAIMSAAEAIKGERRSATAES